MKRYNILSNKEIYVMLYPKYSSENHINRGFTKKITEQMLKCDDNSTQKPLQGVLLEIQRHTVKLYSEKMSFRAIDRLMKINNMEGSKNSLFLKISMFQRG